MLSGTGCRCQRTNEQYPCSAAKPSDFSDSVRILKALPKTAKAKGKMFNVDRVEHFRKWYVRMRAAMLFYSRSLFIATSQDSAETPANITRVGDCQPRR